VLLEVCLSGGDKLDSNELESVCDQFAITEFKMVISLPPLLETTHNGSNEATLMPLVSILTIYSRHQPGHLEHQSISTCFIRYSRGVVTYHRA
jgi:hypothetical protein